MPKTKTTLFDISEHLNTPEGMAAYLEASIEEADGDAAFIAKALPPPDWIAATTSSALSLLVAKFTTTCAPSFASCSAI